MVLKTVTKEAISIAEGLLEGTGQISKIQFQYDFPSLILKLTVYFAIAFTISKFFEAVIFGENTLKAFLNLIGVNLPNSLPEPIVKFFQTGFNGFQYWDIVKILAILLVLYEWFNWYNINKNNEKFPPSPMTHGVFVILASGLAIATFPELIQRIRELRIMKVSQ